MKKNVGILLESPFTLGGEQRVSTILANYLVNHGYNVTFLLYDRKNKVDYSFYNLNKNIKIVFMNKYNTLTKIILRKILFKLKKLNYKYNFFKNSLKFQSKVLCSNSEAKIIAKYINDNKLDYVIGVATENAAKLCLAKKYIKKCKIIGWQHTTFFANFQNPFNRFYNLDLLVKYIFQNIDIYVCQTLDDFNKIKENYNFESVIINNPNTFNNKIKSKLNSKKFIAVGRFVKLKGFDKLIDAFYLFCKYNNDWKLYLVGDGEEKSNYLNLIKKYNLQDRVILTGKVSNVEDYYLDSSIYLMTSLWEGWGMVVTEAMSYGLPVISFNIPSIREIFSNNDCGYLIDNFDVNQFSAKMIDLSNNKNKILDFSKNCTKIVKKFDIQNIGKYWKDILK